jgi:hypothetical protein
MKRQCTSTYIEKELAAHWALLASGLWQILAGLLILHRLTIESITVEL